LNTAINKIEIMHTLEESGHCKTVGSPELKFVADQEIPDSFFEGLKACEEGRVVEMKAEVS